VFYLEKQLWKKPSKCVGQSHCIEVLITENRILIKTTTGTIGASVQEWEVFKQAIKDGEFE
jgi:hypothetical protein